MYNYILEPLQKNFSLHPCLRCFDLPCNTMISTNNKVQGVATNNRCWKHLSIKTCCTDTILETTSDICFSKHHLLLKSWSYKEVLYSIYVQPACTAGNPWPTCIVQKVSPFISKLLKLIYRHLCTCINANSYRIHVIGCAKGVFYLPVSTIIHNFAHIKAFNMKLLQLTFLI